MPRQSSRLESTYRVPTATRRSRGEERYCGRGRHTTTRTTPNLLHLGTLSSHTALSSHSLGQLDKSRPFDLLNLLTVINAFYVAQISNKISMKSTSEAIPLVRCGAFLLRSCCILLYKNAARSRSLEAQRSCWSFWPKLSNDPNLSNICPCLAEIGPTPARTQRTQPKESPLSSLGGMRFGCKLLLTRAERCRPRRNRTKGGVIENTLAFKADCFSYV